jgi:hypothetical protein
VHEFLLKRTDASTLYCSTVRDVDVCLPWKHAMDPW